MSRSQDLLCDVVAAASTLTLRWSSYKFLRLLPWSKDIFILTGTASALYFVAWLTRSRGNAKVSFRSLVTTVAFGTLDTPSMIARVLSLGINILCVLFIIDFTYRAHLLHPSHELSFQRVGWVDATSAQIVLRAPGGGPVQLWYHELRPGSPASLWHFGPVANVTKENDFVAHMSLRSLRPNTKYEYQTNASHSGTFSCPPEYPKQWSMVSSSCIKSFFPYSPLGHSLAIPGMRHLSDIAKVQAIDFVLFLGDFIYIDLPIRHGRQAAHYREAFRQVYASPSWKGLQDIPWIHAYDDHEIENNWSSNETGVFDDAIDAYMIYHHPANPAARKPDLNYYTFVRGDVSFFVVDTRRFRSPGSMPDGPEKTMLGSEQRRDVLLWLQNATGWKVIVSSVPFTRNFRSPDSEDSWAGYLYERQMLLEAMWSSNGALIISGDRHEHATTFFPNPHGAIGGGVIEFSTSPLSQFYEPFRRDYAQVEDSDQAIFSHPWGISKFGVFNFDTRTRGTWSMRFDLIVDGSLVWNHTVRYAEGIGMLL